LIISSRRKGNQLNISGMGDVVTDEIKEREEGEIFLP